MFDDIDIKYTTKNVTRLYFLGFIDSLRMWYPIQLLWSSNRIRGIFMESFKFNMFLLLVNCYFEYFALNYSNLPKSGWWFWTLGWSLPMWVCATLFNFRWNKRMAELLCKKKYQKTTQLDVKQEIAQLIYGELLIFTFQILINLSYVTTYYIRYVILFCGYSWLSSYYLFEKKYIYKGYSLSSRVRFFETRYVYFLGYGTLWSLMYLYLPFSVSYMLYFLLSNFFSLNTINLSPQKGSDQYIPIFRLSTIISEWLVSNIGFFSNKIKKI